ncbi:MAG TPA: ABC transporter substrate-binding protein [Terriglobales bacterium]|nr:ABC transporter substrate-binding protein [Terriglobales bacterium]
MDRKPSVAHEHESRTRTTRPRISVWLLATVLLTTASSADGQQPTNMPRIGYVATTAPDTPNNLAFRRGLRDFGYIEGKNILVEERYAEGKADRLPKLVAELLQLKVDILVSPVTAAIRAAKESTKTIPIVMVIADDPVATGLVESLARPGGNITGLTRLTQELNGKRLELLKEVLPTASRVGVLLVAGFAVVKEYEAAAHALKIQLQSLEVRPPNPDLEGVFRDAVKGRASALIATRALVGYRKQIADLAIKNRLALISEGSDFVVAGGVMSYAAIDTENYRRAAYYVDKILKGTKPADLPVEQPTKFELVINLKTARQIGLTIPANVLARADRVIR